MNTPIKVGVLGVGITPIRLHESVGQLEVWIASYQHQYICVVPAHSIMDAYYNYGLSHIYNQSGMTTPDGMAVVWLLRLLGYPRVSRVYGPDLMRAACARSVETGWKHFLYGGGPGVAEKLAARLQESYPGIQIVGHYSPPFLPLTPYEDEKIVDRINRSGADIVWVGLSSPKQDFWMAEHLGMLNAPVMVGVGAAFDFLSGTKPQAPRWIQHSGFEWLFRLACEPRRLWPRYRQYPLFLYLVFLQLSGIRKFPIISESA